MSDVLRGLERFVCEVERSDDLDLAAFSSLIDRQKARLAQLSRAAVERGEHEVTGRSSVSWVATTCSMTPTSASDCLCVGEQLGEMPKVAAAVRSGDIGYQSASVICHFREKLGEKRELCDEEHWIQQARDLSVRDLRWVTQHVRYMLDPDGFDRDTEEDYEQRYLHLSPFGNMFKLDAVLDSEAGAALRSAIDGLARRLGESDGRTPKQRRADALTSIIHHAMDSGTLPRRNRVRPHITVNTTIEGLQGQVGAPASEILDGRPISNRTTQRLACDGMLSRVVKANSVVIDVGRATANVSPAQWRALKARHKTCGFPGCDRPVSWTSPHHIEFRSHGGPTTLRNLLPLCYYHHRLVHEGGWQIVRAGESLKFIPPDRHEVAMFRRRWGERAA